MNKNIDIYLTSDQLDARISELADQINMHYQGKKLVVVGLMKGCMHFLSDLCRKLNLELSIEIIYAVSYHGTKSSGNVEILLDLRKDIFGANVLVVDDIVDTGLTLNKIKEMLQSREPSTLDFCVLFDKHECRIQPVDIKYIGFEVPNQFFIGYGMDYDGLYRELPFLGVLKNI